MSSKAKSLGPRLPEGKESLLGRLPESPPEVRLAALLFLLVLGVADAFGAWQVANFASFAPRGVAAAVAPAGHHPLAMECCNFSAVGEKPVRPEELDVPTHRIERALLVQDTHVHVPVYAMTAAFLALLIFGLRMPSRARVGLVLLAFAAPVADFTGLWGAHLFPARGAAFGLLAVVGGFAMGACYLAVLFLAFAQLIGSRKETPHA
jgi:hypothetical protein